MPKELKLDFFTLHVTKHVKQLVKNCQKLSYYSLLIKL